MSFIEGERIDGYSQQIRDFCTERNISIPKGFFRYPPSKFVITLNVEQLCRYTFSYDKEIIEYISKLEKGSYKIFNFKDCLVYSYEHGKKLTKGASFNAHVKYHKFST